LGKHTAVHSFNYKNDINANDLRPANCISCDQLESNTTGMMATWKDKPTVKAYKAATIL